MAEPASELAELTTTPSEPAIVEPAEITTTPAEPITTPAEPAIVEPAKSTTMTPSESTTPTELAEPETTEPRKALSGYVTIQKLPKYENPEGWWYPLQQDEAEVILQRLAHGLDDKVIFPAKTTRVGDDGTIEYVDRYYRYDTENGGIFFMCTNLLKMIILYRALHFSQLKTFLMENMKNS